MIECTWENEDGSMGGVAVPEGSVALSPEWQAAREKYRNASQTETNKILGNIALSDESSEPTIE